MATSTKKFKKHFLFIGPTGSGKSTIINALVNESATKKALTNPASTSSRSSGVTSANNIHKSRIKRNYFYTDTIGYLDNRFPPDGFAKLLSDCLKNSLAGFNRIYLCIKYGRISSGNRKYFDLLEKLFGETSYNWCTIIFTYCKNAGKMTKEIYLTENSDDVEMQKLIYKFNNVIFGDNETDVDKDIDEFLLKRRQDFLDVVMNDISAASDEAFKPKYDDLSSWIEQIYSYLLLFYPGSKLNLENVRNEIVLWEQKVNTHHFLGTCLVCKKDMWDNRETRTNQDMWDNREMWTNQDKWANLKVKKLSCGHCFHLQCLGGTSCSICGNNRYHRYHSSEITSDDLLLNAIIMRGK